ncbi:hypothetical protein MMG00_11990 [Ignatzschineria rhizosphaerae]|uniref:DUF4375 domain-containing protein n=1 Tax=Ignatzschineria rhizosphaerae TaxID=2923279 RepID=A0ABY3X1Y8_9GAMM|nr:hypothetical protein [Ignatzschineria rhizosphaerae]UNM95905.1 hypothetical protein MMG00_11990 [Ignatzschineria rhizosphaerae]
MNKIPTPEIFLKDIENHTMTINNDNGVYRSLSFSNKGSFNLAFQIITWDGYLAISGDMGSYVFRRRQDMFKFFRNEELGINPGYWGEKVEAECRRDKVYEFDEEGTAEYLQEYLDNMIENGYSEEEYEKAKEDLEDNGLLEPQSEYDFITSAERSDYLGDNWELRVEAMQKKHSYRFIWCCYAIVWAIQQYDKHQSELLEDK